MGICVGSMTSSIFLMAYPPYFITEFERVNFLHRLKYEYDLHKNSKNLFYSFKILDLMAMINSKRTKLIVKIGHPCNGWLP